MLGSILGFTALNNPTTQPPEGTPPAVDPSQQPTAIQFEATGVEATVQELFPTIFVTAVTNEGEISLVNAKITAISGVKNINNSFYRTEQTGELVYVAEVTIADDASREEIANQISTINIFSESSVFSIGLALIPQKVNFKNAELNLTQDYNFPNPIAQVYLNLGTIKDDKINVTIQAAFAGSTLQNILAAEETNLTASPQIVSLKQEHEILSIEQVLLMEAKLPVTQTDKILQAIEQVNQINGVSNASLQAKDPTDPFVVSFKEGGLLFEADLNTFFSTFSGVSSFEIDANKNFETKVFLQNDQNISELLPKLNQELDSLLFLVNAISAPDVLVQGRIDTNSSDATALSAQIKNTLEQNGLKEISFEQQAKIKADSLTDPDSNTSYPIQNGSFDATISLEKQAGQKVLLTIFVIASRGEILSLSATQATDTNST